MVHQDTDRLVEVMVVEVIDPQVQGIVVDLGIDLLDLEGATILGVERLEGIQVGLLRDRGPDLLQG